MGNKRLDELQFDNRFTANLPADPHTGPGSRQVANSCYSRVMPTHTASPRTAAVSAEVLHDLEIAPDEAETPQFALVFSGNHVLKGMDPHAMVYGGHQFGQWAGQLGDGRAIGLGDVITSDGRHLSLQLKGAGLTPYSRRADGRAVLRSSIREFLCSEAMHHLGVPTTRALSLVTTGDTVVRDVLYDGNARPEPGAVVCRVAPSFLRFGNYELPSSRGDIELLRTLVDYTIRTHFAHLGEPSPDTYLAWFAEVVDSTATMVAEWMRVGFVHGVMNTDNMSIHGLTIDYGPYGWIDNVDLDWTPNTTDASTKRYRFGQQPGVAQWNLSRLASAIYPLINEVEPLQDAIDGFTRLYQARAATNAAAKLGLETIDTPQLAQLVVDLEHVLQLIETDMSIFYRCLANIPVEMSGGDNELLAPLADAFYRPEQLSPDGARSISSWVRRYQQHLRRQGVGDEVRALRMNSVNPKFVLRNYLAQEAIDSAEAGDFSKISTLLEVLRRPFDEQPGREVFAAKRPDWARTRVGCSMLSCSS